jgi:hypothetical protein
MKRLLMATLAIAASSRSAAASCPDSGSPDKTVCRPVSSLFMPSGIGVAYMPGGTLGNWFGGGVEIVTLTWGDSSPAFGPSHGKLRMDFGLLTSTAEGQGLMVQYRGGVQVSFEKNPSRNWLIPYFQFDAGALWVRALGSEGFVDAGVGAYLYYSPRLIFDVGGGWVIPFSDADLLHGPTAHVALGISLW